MQWCSELLKVIVSVEVQKEVVFQRIVMHSIQVVLVHHDIAVVQQVVLDEVGLPLLLVFVHVFVHVAVECNLLVELEDVVHLLPDVTPLVLQVAQFAFGIFFHEEHIPLCEVV